MSQGYEQLDEKLAELEQATIKMTEGMHSVLPTIPNSLFPHLTKSLQLYYGLPNNFQRLLHRNPQISGRAGLLLFQMSRGTQQVKLYQPWIYKNEVNTPLRIRARKIMRDRSKKAT